MQILPELYKSHGFCLIEPNTAETGKPFCGLINLSGVRKHDAFQPSQSLYLGVGKRVVIEHRLSVVTAPPLESPRLKLF